jgi:hypothetical protein
MPLLGNGSGNTLVVRQWLRKRHVTPETLKIRNKKELLEAVLYVGFAPRLCNSTPRGERLSANIKLPLHKPLIRSVINYICPAWEFAVYTDLLKLQRLQNKVLRTTGKFPRCT